MLLKPAFWPHETLHRVGQHEQISLPVRGVVFDDLLRGNGSPLALDPGIPAILRVFVVAGLDLEFRLDGIGNAAAKPRHLIAAELEIIVKYQVLTHKCQEQGNMKVTPRALFAALTMGLWIWVLPQN